MRNTTILLSVILFLATFVGCKKDDEQDIITQESEEHPSNMCLKTGTKFIKPNQTEDFFTHEYTYNKQGLVVKLKYGYEKHGYDFNEWEYDDKGRVITYKQGKNKTTRYVYDSKDKVLYMSVFASNELTEHYYTYNQDNLLEKEVIEDPDDYTVIIYEYDSYGNLIKETHERPHLEDKVIYYAYNNSGQLIEHRAYNEYGAFLDWFKYEYDANGNVSKEITVNLADTTNSKETVSVFDNKNNLIERTYYSYNGGIVGKRIYKLTYSDEGWLVKEERFDMNNSLVETKEHTFTCWD